MTITTNFVSSPAEVGFADAAEALEAMAGVEVAAGQASLSIGGPVARGVAGAVIFSGVLRSGGIVSHQVPVDVVVSPWSVQKSEIGIRPLSRTGRDGSLSSRLFLRAGWAVLPELIAALTHRVGVDQPVLEVAA